MVNTFWQIVNTFLEGDYITCGIYCYIDKNDNQIVYVGKDSNIDRSIRHKAHYESSKYNVQPINRILQSNPDRYTYQVLVWNVDSQERLNALEIQYIQQLKPKFNFTDGGDGISGFRHSEKTKKKISEANKGKTPWNKGKTHSEETRKKMSESLKGENNPMYGKRHSEETRKKISESKSKAQNTTGFYRVSKQKNSSCKQGFTWRYKYYDNNKPIAIKSTDLKKLKEKVKAQNLPWKIINKEYVKQSLREDKI